MTYGELFAKWAIRILIITLVICLLGIVTVSVAKSRQALHRSDAIIERCDAWAERSRGR